MTSHTPQPPAGDDLVARLREGVAYLGSIEGDVETYDIDSANELMLKAAEALTSQQHTEPVAGEVEVVGWTTPLVLEAMREPDIICGTIWPKEMADLQSAQPPIALVTKSSYDALAAAKDATIAELQAALDSDPDGSGLWRFWSRKAVEVSQKLTDLIDRAEAAERQRDALREALTDVRAFLTTHISVRRHEGDSYYSQTLARVEAALKDEGSAT